MDITTKFNVSEEVFMPYRNEVLTEKIARVIVVAESNIVDGKLKVRTTVHYDIHSPHKGDEFKNVSESKLYKTKKAAAREVIRNMGYYVSEDDLKDI